MQTKYRKGKLLSNRNEIYLRVIKLKVSKFLQSTDHIFIRIGQLRGKKIYTRIKSYSIEIISVNMVRDKYGTFSFSEFDLYRAIYKLEMLILDDLGI